MQQAPKVHELADLRAENAALRSRLADAQASLGCMREGDRHTTAAEELRALLAPIPDALASLRPAFAHGQQCSTALAVLERQFTALARMLDDPRVVQPAARGRGDLPGGGRLGARVPRVLVVDDNKDAAHSLAGLLARDGARVEVAFDGPSALKRAECWRPDLVILDIGMPGMDGHEVARRVRARSDLPQPMLIAMSGLGQAADRQRSLEAGFDRHLIKPFSFESVQSLLSPGPILDRAPNLAPNLAPESATVPSPDADSARTDLAAGETTGAAVAGSDNGARPDDADAQSSAPRALLHDLAQPLNTIACYAVAARNLAAKAAGDAAPLAHALRGIEQQILRAGEVLDQLRALCLRHQATDPDELGRSDGGAHE